MKSPEYIISGIRNILFGQLQPESAADRFNPKLESFQADSLWEMPETPSDYLNKVEKYLTHRQGEEVLWRDTKWIKPFYKNIRLKKNAFHPLCRFYENLIECECLMAIQELNNMQEKLELTLLKYSLVTLQRELIEVIKESERRKGELNIEVQTEGSLEQYVYELLFRKVTALLMDIQLRYHSSFEERAISQEKLFIKYLEKPLPAVPVVYRTKSGTEFELSLSASKEDVKERIERLLLQVYDLKEINNAAKEIDDLNDSTSILENAWFILCLQASDNRGDLPLAGNTDRNREYLENVLRQLHNGSLKSDALRNLKEAVDVAIQVLDIGDGRGSLSVQIAAFIHELANKNDKEGKQKSNGKRDTPSPLDEYISWDELRELTGVSDVTLNKYLNQAEVDVIKFSQKTKYIHRDNLDKMINYFTVRTENKPPEKNE